MRSIPQHITLQQKKSCGIRVGLDMFRLVNVLGGGSSLVRGSAFWQFIVENLLNKHLSFGGSLWLIHQEGGSFDTQFCMAFILSR